MRIRKEMLVRFVSVSVCKALQTWSHAKVPSGIFSDHLQSIEDYVKGNELANTTTNELVIGFLTGQVK